MLNINILKVKLYSMYLYHIISCEVFIVMSLLIIVIVIALYLFVLAIYYICYINYIKK